MNDRWRPQATVAIVCVALLPICFAVAWVLDGIPGAAGIGVAFVFIVSCLIVAVGLVCAIAGVRRGSFASRAASWICLSLLFLPTASVVALFVCMSVAFPGGRGLGR